MLKANRIIAFITFKSHGSWGSDNDLDLSWSCWTAWSPMAVTTPLSYWIGGVSTVQGFWCTKSRVHDDIIVIVILLSWQNGWRFNPDSSNVLLYGGVQPLRVVSYEYIFTWSLFRYKNWLKQSWLSGNDKPCIGCLVCYCIIIVGNLASINFGEMAKYECKFSFGEILAWRFWYDVRNHGS